MLLKDLLLVLKKSFELSMLLITSIFFAKLSIKLWIFYRQLWISIDCDATNV